MSGRRTAFELVNNAKQVAERFTVGDRVSICYTSDSFPGIVTKVEAEIGKVWVDFAGNVKQMDPYEIRHDVADVVPIKDSDAYTVTPVSEKETTEASVDKRRQALYHFQPGRHYKLTYQEQEEGIAHCPRCRAEMTRAPFARGIQLYECPDCEFRITTDHVFDAEYKIPAQNDDEFPVTDESEEPMDVRIAKRISAEELHLGGERLVYDLIRQLSELQDEIADASERAGQEIRGLEAQAAAIESKIMSMMKVSPFQSTIYEALAKFRVNTGSLGSNFVDTVERAMQKSQSLKDKSIYPPSWPVRRPNYSVITSSRKTVLAAAGPLTLLQQLEDDQRKGFLQDDEHLRMVGHGWGHTPGADYIYGEAAEEIVWQLLGYAAGRKEADQVRQTIKKNLPQALKENEPFKGLRGEQKETHEIWMNLMDQRRSGLKE